MDRIETYKILLRVAEMQSFSAAAKVLHLPNATVSDAVRRLEHALGTQLLARTTRSVQLTPDGTAFCARIRDVLSDIEGVESMFRQDTEGLRGMLRVDLPHALARDVVIPRLPDFLNAHPQLTMVISATDRRADLVRDGLDCILRVGAVGQDQYVARRLGNMRMINVASPAYLKRFGVPRSLADLVDHRVVQYALSSNTSPASFDYFDGEKTLEVQTYPTGEYRRC